MRWLWNSVYETRRISKILKWPDLIICISNLYMAFILVKRIQFVIKVWSHVKWQLWLTSSPKGNDRSPESNVPRSNAFFSAIKANHSKVNSPETLFSPLKVKMRFFKFLSSIVPEILYWTPGLRTVGRMYAQPERSCPRGHKNIVVKIVARFWTFVG